MKIFLDTMIWLHYRPIEDIDVAQFAPKGTAITIMVPRITMRELDKHKDEHPFRKIRERARRTLTLIEQAASQNGYQLKNGMRLEVYNLLPNADWEKLGLRKESPDENLIATVLRFQDEHKGEEVRLYTQDTTPRITAKPLGVNALPFPADLKLADELDSDEKEHKELKAELLRLKTLRPILDFGFVIESEQAKTLAISLKRNADFPKDRIDAYLLELKNKYPLIDTKNDPAPNKLTYPAYAISRPLDPIAVTWQERDRYNQEVIKYLSDMEAYCHTLYKFNAAEMLSLSFTLQIQNSGSNPAEDIDIQFRFPAGFLLSETQQKPPLEPSPPEHPRSFTDILFQSFDSPTLFNDGLKVVQPNFTSEFSLRKTNGYEASDHVQRIKHGHSYSLQTLTLTFPSFDAATSFQIEYRITAANIPDAAEGVLNVRVEKEA